MNEPKNDNLALSGIKVVDLTRALAGPVCSALLADMGAEVIRVENPDKDNDPANQSPADAVTKLLHRNKKSITLNMRSEKGKDILRRLIEWGDVLVENYKPGVMKEMGFDYPEVKKINPGIVMVSISGYGQTGPYAGRAGLDGVGQAMAGMMSLTGPIDEPPMTAGGPVADSTSGAFGAFGAVLALYRRNATGLGQHVESTLMDSVAFVMSFHVAKYSIGQTDVKGGIPMPGTGTFRTKDGRYINIMGSSAKHFVRFAHLIGRDDLATAPGYSNRIERLEHAVEINDAIQTWIGTQTITAVEAAMEEEGIPFGKVQTIEELIKDPNMMARNRIVDVEVDGQKRAMIGPYPILSDTPGTIRTPCPKLGEHNDEVYGSILGFSKNELATLKSDGVI
jgi:crotonobetainyl-CoA:carnitine CoA-transferase CaiB-like acyl-CoA transferase